MANIIRHQGVVESIEGNHIQVRISQVSACTLCNAKGYCSASEAKEKIINVADIDATKYKKGDIVWIIGQSSVGRLAVLLAFILPFLVVVISLSFFLMLWSNELVASLLALLLLIPYYGLLWLKRKRLAKKVSFAIQAID